jgi:hypothetical protein
MTTKNPGGRKRVTLRAAVKRLLTVLGLHAVYDCCCLIAGWLYFRRTGVTPRRAHVSLVSLFCQTAGASNDLIHRFITARKPLLSIDCHGVLGTLDQEKVQDIASQLQERGYYVFDRRLSADLCDRLLDLGLTKKAVVKVDKRPITERYDRQRPRGVRYDFTESTLIRSDAVQELMADASILSVAQAYLRSAPVLDLIAMWWHTSWSEKPDADAGQMFHFDMDRIKWLKFFFYITDVGQDNGPHWFVAGSHRTKGIPRPILRKGQVRIEDEEVMGFYSPDDLIEFCGPRGTIIAEDTRGLHKGMPVRANDRLLFQLEFSDSLFGMDYPNVRNEVIRRDGPLQAMTTAYPDVYSRYFGNDRGA